MKTEATLTCSCGTVSGRIQAISTRYNNHLVCYCEDCQAFARHLGADAKALDANGGTEIMQVTPQQIQIDKGADQLRCLRLSRKGPFRWYTNCCRTPVANTVSAGLPFAGVVAAFISSPHDDLGPVRYRIQGQYAIDPPPDLEIDPAFPRLMTLRIVGQMLLARIAGKHKPSPFFGEDGRPLSKPDIVNEAESG